MNIRKLVTIAAALCIAPAAFAQATSGGSAGDGDKPLNYTKASFAELDKDKNGSLDKKELVGTPLSAALVKKIDTNADGMISEAEFTAYEALNAGNKVPKK